MAKKIDYHVDAHQRWLDFVQPIGLVVSPTALVRAGAILEINDMQGQRTLKGIVEERIINADGETEPWLPSFTKFSQEFLDWDWHPERFSGTEDSPVPENLEVSLIDYDEVLRPDFAVREPDVKDDALPWQLFVRELNPGEDFDKHEKGKRWEASPHARMERLLREKEIPAGLLFNGVSIRLLSAPRGESSGWLDFKVSNMLETQGRPISAALRLLLRQQRLLNLPQAKRLPNLLSESRKYQNEVSEKLAQQVLHSLYELLRGLQAAQDASKGELLRGPLQEKPDLIYHSLLTSILRLVFVLYAEERDMLPQNEVFVRHYSLTGLYERLRSDAALYPDTMNQRYGAWPQLLALFRMVFDGAEAGEMKLPSRHGELFDPQRFPFLEGRNWLDARQTDERIIPPAIPDGYIFRALENLLLLDGERISYRALDVEQIGSVYETMMGFRVERSTGQSIAVKGQKKNSAPSTIDLEYLLDTDVKKRAKWIQDKTDRKLTSAITKAVEEAQSLEDIHIALEKVIDRGATPDLVAKHSMILQPSAARRKSGSHYTPRELTQPIVETTLRPILERLREECGGIPTPEAILDLKVCDPAMGSGAFLVETCRQLGDALIESWAAHDARPEIPEDEDEVLAARRMVAQRCLYGVDRNPVAVDLAKVSLWLATLAKDHAFTFVNHVLRHGDALVGLTKHQLMRFEWKEGKGALFASENTQEHLTKYTNLRQKIRNADEGVSDGEIRDMWAEAKHELSKVRFMGDLVCAAFFEGKNDKEREAKLAVYSQAVRDGNAQELYSEHLEGWRERSRPLVPFHWEVEFPEVFDRDNGGFNSFVGNPPFAGKNTTAAGNPDQYLHWLKHIHEGIHGNNTDLVAHFFRRCHTHVRSGGTFGLIATNTIGQGDSRKTGLAWICENGSTIYSATKRLKWPGQAAVMVSVVHVVHDQSYELCCLDGLAVPCISSFLVVGETNSSPHTLPYNKHLCFQGVIILGMGFTFNDNDKKGKASSIKEMERLLDNDAKHGDVILPYIGGSEVNDNPLHQHHRYVINFGVRNEEECRRAWPAVMKIVEDKVRPDRMKQKDKIGQEEWWQFLRKRPELQTAIDKLQNVIVCNCGASKFLSFARISAQQVFANSLAVFPLETNAAFCALQARPHEIWARFFGSSLEDRLRYTTSDVFETFPFPENWQTHPQLEEVGKAYYEFRADLMIRNDEGLTKTYNRFHDPEQTSTDILKLRELHTKMDRAVLQAYDWDDIDTTCDFILDYEVEDEEAGSKRKKKPWRYRWPDAVRDEILARLLELNAQRAKDQTVDQSPSQRKTKITDKLEGGLF